MRNLPRSSEIKIEMRKASFGGDRSEAGRYAANVRWQNKKGEELKGSEGGTQMSSASVQIAENKAKIAELKENLDKGFVYNKDADGNPIYQKYPQEAQINIYAEIKLLEGKNKRLETEGNNPSALVLPTLPSGAQVDANRVGAEKLQDIKDVSTDEADFARRLGILVDNAAKFGQNLTTKHTKNESSKGQKINPTKLYEDDRMALAEITDPVERAKYIDGLLKEPMYQDRIVARPPKKKTN
jgi:hypothetical protein